MREGLEFETDDRERLRAAEPAVLSLMEAGMDVHCLRDLTRGGLGTTLIEIAEATGLQITIDETAIPVRDDVAGACEVLGFDPLYLANEGRMIAIRARGRGRKGPGTAAKESEYQRRGGHWAGHARAVAWCG